MDIFIKEVLLSDGESLKDVAFKYGKITAIEEAITESAKRVIAAKGRVFITRFVESSSSS